MEKYIEGKLALTIIRSEYKNWISSLTEKEIYAIRKYTYNSRENKPEAFFVRINAFLRNEYNQYDSKMLEKYADIISEAIRKHPLEHNIICYRGSNCNHVEGLRPGTVFAINQFVSTSISKNRMFSRKYKYIIYAPKGTKGAYIEDISVFPKQKEFLLDKENKYKLLCRKNNTVYMEVVVDDQIH